MSLRERIDESILRAIHDVETAEPYSGYPDRDDHVDDILAAVREALLSPEAVEAMMRHYLGIKSPYGQELYRDDARAGIDAALDAAGITEADDE